MKPCGNKERRPEDSISHSEGRDIIFYCLEESKVYPKKDRDHPWNQSLRVTNQVVVSSSYTDTRPKKNQGIKQRAVEGIKSCKYEWWSYSTNFLCWSKRRVEERPKEGTEETNFSKNE